MLSRRLVVILAICLGLVACKQTISDPGVERRYEHGVYLLCEGNFGWGEGSVFYYDTSAKAQDVEDAYKMANGFAPGNVVQSMAFDGDMAYLVVNNSNKIEALDAHTLKRKAINSTLTSPRYAVSLPGDHLAVTDLYANRISFLNSSDLSTITTLKAPGWTEQAVSIQNRLYVANRRPTIDALDSLNEQILVIDPYLMIVIDSIKLNGQGAQEIIILPDGNLCTSLEKDFTLDGKPSIIVINSSSKKVSHFKALDNYTQQPSRIQAMDEWLFWVQGDRVCYMSETGGNIQSFLPFVNGSNVTSLLLLRHVKNKIRLIVGNSKDYTSAGLLKDLNIDLINTTIEENRMTSVGIIPGEAYAF